MFYGEATGALLHICGQGVSGTAEISEYCFPTRGRDDARGQDGGVGCGTGLRNCPNARVPYRAGTVYPWRGEFSLGVDITNIGKLWAARSVVRVITDASFQVAEALGIGDLLVVVDVLVRQHQYAMFVKRGLKSALVACANGIL